MSDLRERYNRALNRYKNELIRQQSYKEVQGLPDSNAYNSFKVLKYDTIMEKGITRRIGNNIVRYKGEEAVETQIKSLRNLSSRFIMKKRFIENYVQAMRTAGYDSKNIASIENKLKNTAADVLSILANSTLPPISLIESEDVFISKLSKRSKLTNKERARYTKAMTQRIASIHKVLDYGVPNISSIRQKVKELKPINKARMEIINE